MDYAVHILPFQFLFRDTNKAIYSLIQGIFNFTILGLKPKRFLYNEKIVFFYEREREGGKRALPVIQFFAMVSPVLTNFNLWRTK